MFIDQLIEAIREKNSPICVGIDPIFESLPPEIAGDASKRNGNDLTTCVDAIYEFTVGVLKTVAPYVACVKFQSAYFEKYLWEGVQAYYELIHEAKQLGLLVIGDVKRGDIGSTSAAYASAHLDELTFTDLDSVATPDAITVNPFLGPDTIEPFLDICGQTGKGVFVLVRTSNPGSADFQDAKLANGLTLSEQIASALQPRASARGLCGTHGWSNVGAVVGATQAHTMKSLREKLPNSFFLLPGYGTQGATAEMTKLAFKDGLGAIVSASRSILYPTRGVGETWINAVRRATRAMRADLAAVV